MSKKYIDWLSLANGIQLTHLDIWSTNLFRASTKTELQQGSSE